LRYATLFPNEFFITFELCVDFKICLSILKFSSLLCLPKSDFTMLIFILLGCLLSVVRAARVPFLTLEEHILSDGISNASSFAEKFKYQPGAVEKMRDTGSTRLQNMDLGSVAMQVLSHGAGLGDSTIENCIIANNDMARRVSSNPTRYKAFAALPMCPGCVKDAVTELKRTIRELGFVGALIDNHYLGQHFEGEVYRPLWQAAQDLDVPIYLHPTWPSPDMEARYSGNVSTVAAAHMGTVSWGWHSDTGLHIQKLFAAGVFDDFPKLKIIIGHYGEMLPFMLERISTLSTQWGARKRSFMQVYNESIWMTTSGVWSLNPLATMLLNTKVERILYSVDYPFASNEAGLALMEQLRKSGLVTEKEFEMIAHGNAETLLKIAPLK
jgi:predicted TIM-barrel fold metal-dependent hydrolase